MIAPPRQLLFAACVIAADRLSKAMVSRRLAVGSSATVGGWFRIRHTIAPFSSSGFKDSRIALLSLWAAQLAGVMFITQSEIVFQRPAAQMALITALAGAASNLYDRLRRGKTVDFLDLGWWPVFNLADVAITVGVGTAIFLM